MDRALAPSITPRARRVAAAWMAAGALLALAFAGCEDRSIRTYQVEKEKPRAGGTSHDVPGANAPATEMATPDPSPDATSGLSPTQARARDWPLPVGWERVPAGGMRVASCRVRGASGGEVDVSVIPLTGAAGSDLDNVNRWRAQLGLPPVDAAGLAGCMRPIDIGGRTVALVEIGGGAPPRRTLAAIVRDPSVTWFFKAAGPDALVAAERGRFIEFVRQAPIFGGAGGSARR